MKDTTAGIINKYNKIKSEYDKCPSKTTKAWLDTFLVLEWRTIDEDNEIQ